MRDRYAGGYHHRAGGRRGLRGELMQRRQRGRHTHGDTSCFREGVPLRPHSVEFPSGLRCERPIAGLLQVTTHLQERLVNTPTPSDDPHHRPAPRRNDLLRPRWQSHTGLAIVTVSNDRRVVPTRPCQSAPVPDLLLDIADDGAFWALRDGEDVADRESRFLATVDERASRDTLGCDERLLAEFVAVRVSENDCR